MEYTEVLHFSLNMKDILLVRVHFHLKTLQRKIQVLYGQTQL